MANSMVNTSTMTLPAVNDDLNNYLSKISTFPVLSAEKERGLAVRYRDEEDLDAARDMVMSQLRFVVHLARSYTGYGLPLADLVQEGNIGLMKAVKRFDPDVGVRLISFAVHWIRAEIHEYVIRNWRIVKVATTKAQRKLFFKLRSSKKGLGWFSHNYAETQSTTLAAGMENLDDRSRDILQRRWLNEDGKSTLQDLADEYGALTIEHYLSPQGEGKRPPRKGGLFYLELQHLGAVRHYNPLFFS